MIFLLSPSFAPYSANTASSFALVTLAGKVSFVGADSSVPKQLRKSLFTPGRRLVA
jgi:hypothetical protein